jgi:AraC family transcriptional regulator of adaptative response/methylated-DNA-[protein]-cysteine methyltransferase
MRKAVPSPAFKASLKGSRSRVYERSANHLGMTPATYRRQGTGQEIRYTFMPSPLGLMIVAATERGICSVLSANDLWVV